MASVGSCLICPLWILLHLFAVSAMNTLACTEFSQSESISDHHILQGQSTTINCHYNKTRSQYLVVVLKTEHRRCEYYYLNKNWTKQFCNDSITFIWIQETEAISFQLLNLQLNNSGLYTCTVDKHIPPPTSCLGVKRIFVHVKAPPSVSVSCAKSSDGVPTVLCASEGFYPNDLMQAWIKDEEYIGYLNTSFNPLYMENLNPADVSWNYSKNTDGTYSVASYLRLPLKIQVYYCWVNHSTLIQPITVNISNIECTERKETLSGMFSPITGIICGIASIGVILAICYPCLRGKTHEQSSVDASSLPTPVSHSSLETLGIYQQISHVYSTLEDHQPVSQVYSTPENHQPVSQVYSTLGCHQPVSHVYSTLENHQPVSEVYSTLGDHWHVSCSDNSNDTISV